MRYFRLTCSFAAGFTIPFPFCLIKSRGGEDAVAYMGETAFEPSGEEELLVVGSHGAAVVI
jgi:hypothetical protein